MSGDGASITIIKKDCKLNVVIYVMDMFSFSLCVSGIVTKQVLFIVWKRVGPWDLTFFGLLGYMWDLLFCFNGPGPITFPFLILDFGVGQN